MPYKVYRKNNQLAECHEFTRDHMSKIGDFEIIIASPPTTPRIIDDVEEKILCPLSCVRELESKWILEFDLPLVNKNDIEVSLLPDNVITVAAKLRETFQDLELDYRREFQFFKKSIALPGKIDINKITASFKNGSLTILAPKIFKGNKIKVE